MLYFPFTTIPTPQSLASLLVYHNCRQSPVQLIVLQTILYVSNKYEKDEHQIPIFKWQVFMSEIPVYAQKHSYCTKLASVGIVRVSSSSIVIITIVIINLIIVTSMWHGSIDIRCRHWERSPHRVHRSPHASIWVYCPRYRPVSGIVHWCLWSDSSPWIFIDFVFLYAFATTHFALPSLTLKCHYC